MGSAIIKVVVAFLHALLFVTEEVIEFLLLYEGEMEPDFVDGLINDSLSLKNMSVKLKNTGVLFQYMPLDKILLLDLMCSLRICAMSSSLEGDALT